MNTQRCDMHIDTYIHSHTHTYTFFVTHTHTHTHAHIHMLAHTHMHTFTCSHTHTHTHTHTVLFVFLFFFTTPPILVASINNIKFIQRIEETTFNVIQVCPCMLVVLLASNQVSPA